MAKTIDPKLEGRVKLSISKRIRQSRLSLNLSADAVAEAIGHANSTQVRLCESGDRVLPIHLLVKICDIYGISLDYLTGRISDPIAEPFEVSQGVITSVVSQAIKQSFDSFASTTAERVAVAISAYRQDRVDLSKLVDGIAVLGKKYERMKELNMDFDDDIAGANNVEKELRNLSNICQSIQSRFCEDEKQFDRIDESSSDFSEVESKVRELVSALN